jgi:integrase/recombinase XerD
MTRNMALATTDGSSGTVSSLVNWQTALETFLNTLSSPRTQKAYERAVTEAMRAMGMQCVADLTPPMLAAYRAGLVARLDIDREDRLSPSTVSLKLGAVRSFLHFCRLTSVTPLGKDLTAFVLKSPRAEVRRPYEVLSEAERRRFLDAASVQGLREKALVSLALGAGLRVSELVDLYLDDFSQDEAGGWWLRVRMGKGRKDRLVPIHPSVMDAVKAWLAADGRSLGRKSDRETYLFNTRQSPRMTTSRAWQIVQGLARQAGIEKPISPHSLRHTMGRPFGRLVNISLDMARYQERVSSPWRFRGQSTLGWSASSEHERVVRGRPTPQ